MRPRVSVVVACRDEPREFLRECLASVLEQTVSDWEAVIVDDASTTGHLNEVLRELADPRFRVVRHTENRGLGASRNSGIQAAAAPLIALLDADDRLDAEFLAATERPLDERPDVDWAVTDWRLFGARDEVWPFPIEDSLNCPAHFLFVGAGALMRRSVWHRLGGYAEDPRLSGAEDWDFWLAAAEHQLRPRHIARPLYFYRVHAAAMSRTTSPHTEHTARRLLYQRHRSAFHSMGLDCPRCASPRQRVAAFLGQGYLVSSQAALRQGGRWRAVRLAMRGLAFRPQDRALILQLGRAVVPTPLRRLVGRMRS